MSVAPTYAIDAAKKDIIYDLFVVSADENYITARWCFMNDLRTDFGWLAAHAMEKYLKAFLLINGNSVQEFSHLNSKIFNDSAEVAGTLFPATLFRPNEVSPNVIWPNETPIQFVNRLAEIGSPDDRYRMSGDDRRMCDLYMLDQLVFAVRRCIKPLDSPCSHYPELHNNYDTWREFLEKNPADIGNLGLPMGMALRDASLPTAFAALNCNFAFAPSNYLHEEIIMLSGWSQSAITRHLGPLNAQDPIGVAIGIEVSKWLVKNVRLGARKSEIENAVKAANADCN